tara:strand:+ start:3499 stop:4188 length:690 start_codon:yes stop_codon:yes gene_type:complete
MIQDILRKNKKIVILSSVVILSIVILYLLSKQYEYKNTYEPILIRDVHNIKLYRVDDSVIKKANEGIQYSYSFWLYIDNISGSEHWKDNYYTDKVIFKKGYSPIVYYNPKENNIKIGIKTKTDRENVETHIINNVKLQQWTHIVLCIDNRNLDVYLNGSLYKSYKLNNVPIFDNQPFFLGSRSIFNGRVGYLRYFNKCLNDIKVMKLYNDSKPSKEGNPNPSSLWWIKT